MQNIDHEVFPNRLEGYWENDNRRFTLTQPFTYNDVEKDILVMVPVGFTTDWNSTPSGLVWAYFAPWEYPEAGLIHDWLYKRPGGFQSTSYTPPLTRQQADDVHRRILDLKGCRWSKRQLIYGVLRAVGGVAWNRHRSNDTTSVGKL